MAINRVRSAQINNLKQHYSLYPSVISGRSAIIPSVEWSITGTALGTSSASPAVLRFPNLGPFALTLGNTFSLAISGYNENRDTTITIDSSCFSGTSVTVSRLAKKINDTFGAPLALNDAGCLTITTKSTSGSVVIGSDSFIRISNSTSGVIQIFGFSPLVNSYITYGTSSLTRGLVINSSKGSGGKVLVKSINSSPASGVGAVNVSVEDAVARGYGTRAVEKSDVWRSYNYNSDTFNYQYYVDPGDGGELSGILDRIQDGSDSLRLRFVRSGQAKPRINSNVSSIYTITSSDRFLYSITSDKLSGGGFNRTIMFTSTPTSVDDAIQQINLSWANATNAFARIVGNCGGPWYLSGGFVITGYGITNPIEVNFPSATYNVAEVVDFINGAIVANAADTILIAEVTRVETANAVYETFSVKCLSTVDICKSYIEVSPYNNSLGALKAVGINPGVYGAAYIAEPFGLDEISITNPLRAEGALLTLYSSTDPSTPGLSKLGIPSGSNSLSEYSLELIEATSSFLLFPEVMEEKEVPSNVDELISNFENRSATIPGDPKIGVKNVAGAPMASPKGPIDPELIPTILNDLGLNHLKLGATNNYYREDLLKPRVEGVTNLNLDWTCLLETADVESNHIKTRVYLAGTEGLVVTYNAKRSWAGYDSYWEVDDNLQISWRTTLPLMSSIYKVYYAPSAGSDTWAEDAWISVGDLGTLGPSGTSALCSLNLKKIYDSGILGSRPVTEIDASYLDGNTNQILTILKSSLPIGTLRTYGSGFLSFITFNAIVSPDFTTVTRDVSGASWILAFAATAGGGVSILYDDTGTTDIGAFKTLFSTNKYKSIFNVPITNSSFTAIENNPLILIDSYESPAKYAPIWHVRSDQQQNYITQYAKTTPNSSSLYTTVNARYYDGQVVNPNSVGYLHEIQSQQSSGTVVINEAVLPIATNTPILQRQRAFNDASGLPRVSDRGYDNSYSVYTALEGRTYNTVSNFTCNYKLLFGNSWGGYFYDNITGDTSVSAVAVNAEFDGEKWNNSDGVHSSSMFAFTREGIKLLDKLELSGWDTQNWNYAGSLARDNTVFARATISISKLANQNATFLHKSSYNLITANTAIIDNTAIAVYFFNNASSQNGYTFISSPTIFAVTGPAFCSGTGVALLKETNRLGLSILVTLLGSGATSFLEFSSTSSQAYDGVILEFACFGNSE